MAIAPETPIMMDLSATYCSDWLWHMISEFIYLQLLCATQLILILLSQLLQLLLL